MHIPQIYLHGTVFDVVYPNNNNRQNQQFKFKFAKKVKMHKRTKRDIKLHANNNGIHESHLSKADDKQHVSLRLRASAL